jgi:integrase
MTPLEEVIITGRRLAEHTKRAYLQGIRDFIAYAGSDPQAWTFKNADAWMEQLRQRVEPQTANLYLLGLKRASARLHAIDGAIDFAKAVEEFPEGRQVRENAPQRSLSIAERRRLLATTDGPGFFNVRDRAIILLGLRGALRREEMTKLVWANLRGNALTVHGKGNHVDEVQLDQIITVALEAWRQITRPKPTDPIFFKARQSIGAPRKALTPDGIYKILKKRAAEAHVNNFSPHTLRHTCATMMAENGVPEWRRQKHMRHRGRTITNEVYTHDNLGSPTEGLPVE